MAVVLLSPAAYDIGAMSHRRTPLSSLPNAANSPYRTVTAAASKRSREEAGLQENSVNDQQRSVKRQLLESRTSNFRTPPRKPASQSGADDGVFGKKAANRKPTDFDRKLLAVQQPQGVEKQEKAPQRTNVEEWQKHYRKAFPLYVFYFENVSEEARLECSRVIRALGAVSHLLKLVVHLLNKPLTCRSRGKKNSFLEMLPISLPQETFLRGATTVQQSSRRRRRRLQVRKRTGNHELSIHRY